jgi:RNA polymerase sigma-70 factor (sigma-E family)
MTILTGRRGRPVAESQPSVPGIVGADADAAVEQLYAAHWRQLVRLSVLLVHDQAAAEDVVQDAFVAMHGKWSRLRDPDKALAYLRQAVVNRSRSALRHRVVVERHARMSSVSDVTVDGPTVGGARRDAVKDALRQLTDRQREVLVLRYYLDWSEAQIADALGISLGAVKAHAHRGSAALRELLGDWWEDES